MSWEGLRRLEWIQLCKVEKRLKEIYAEKIWSVSQPIRDVAAAETMDHVCLDKGRRLNFKPVQAGWRWGQPWSTAWLRLRFKIPVDWSGELVELRFKTGGECQIFRDNEPVHALDYGRSDYILVRRARGGEAVELFIEAGANEAFGKFARRTMEQPLLAVRNREVWDFYWDAQALYAMVTDKRERLFDQRETRALAPDDPRRAQILRALFLAVDRLDYQTNDRTVLHASARRARALLAPVLSEPAAASAPTIACVGHSHIDVAWLWPLAETVRKCGRTFSNALALMEQYPEYIFAQSQPQLYQYAKDRWPQLYRRIRKQVRAGRWIPTGVLWVEPDSELSGGESIVRQVLVGSRFFKEEFGLAPDVAWLPDSFGYPGSLPQILQRSGIRYFFTQKLSWSQFSHFPNHSFWWEGVDGSRVLAHMAPCEDYNSNLSAGRMLTAARDYRQKDCSRNQLVPYGWGDGGGGPTPMHMELMRRYRNLDGMPKLQPMAPLDFYKRLEKESAAFPAWVGELYLEYHRGCATTQARNKRANRKTEFALRETEWLASLSHILGQPAYPAAELARLWRLALLNQFHDILPGSSIGKVYEDSLRQYADLLASAEKLQAKSRSALLRKIDRRGPGQPVVVFNSTSWVRHEAVAVQKSKKLPADSLEAVAPDGAVVAVQKGEDGRLYFKAKVPAMGHAVYHLRSLSATVAPRGFPASTRRMENEHLRLEFDPKGALKRVFDKDFKREVLLAGETGNRIRLYEDKTHLDGDAWDMEIFVFDKILAEGGTLESAKIVEDGPVRTILRQTRRISRSRIVQDIILASGSRRVDFVTTVEWGDEAHVYLCAEFPLNVLADHARYEIPYGSVERPTHWNRPQDFGMFEVPAQKWADLSESGYGVALLNDSKYGHGARGSTLRLSLLRAPKFPDPKADINCAHLCTYSLFPHGGDFTQGVVPEAYALNAPLVAEWAPRGAGPLPGRMEWLTVSAPNVAIEAVKKAEDDDDLIVRLYECHGRRGPVRITFNWPARKVVETNLLEQPESNRKLDANGLTLEFTPFQIRTLKVSAL